MSIGSDPRPGRPRTSTGERGVKLVAEALEDRRATCEEFYTYKVYRAVGIPATSVLRMLTNDLKNETFLYDWLPLSLTAEQKQKRLDIATLLKERFDVEDLVSNCRY